MKKKKKIIGTLVPISALSSIKTPENQGTFETGLYFLDWLHKTHQSAWQLLPLHQTQLEKGSATTHVPSPYKGYGIGLDPKYLGVSGVSKVSKVSKALDTRGTRDALDTFIRENKDWLEDYALFCAIRDHFGTDDWREWEVSLRTREKESILKWSKRLEKEIGKHVMQQFQLHTAYFKLRKKAKKLGILLIGDLPFYLSINSPLVWTHQEAFQIPKNGVLRFVSGIPNTKSAHFGRQVWGHPLYNWELQSRLEVMKFWQMRLKYLSLLFDSIRFDHAKAFFDFGVMDLEEKEDDKYVKGPGYKVFEEIMNYGKDCGLAIFAEDSGENLSELRSCLSKLKTPGIKILRFALNEKKKRLNKEYSNLSKYPTNTVAYSTTHDTETLMGYLQNLTPAQKIILALDCSVEYVRNDEKFARILIKGLFDSPARIVILPIQDWLLTTDRINIPGTEKEVGDPNWRYKLEIPIEKLPLI